MNKNTPLKQNYICSIGAEGAHAANQDVMNLGIPFLIFVVAIFVLGYVPDRIDKILISRHRQEVERIMGIGTISDLRRGNFWYEFLFKQAMRQFGDPELNRLMYIAFAVITTLVGTIAYELAIRTAA